MEAITRIDVRLKTGSLEGAGTDGIVYLGICGREFHLDSSLNDFEKNSDKVYILGDGKNIEKSELNDPRSPQLYMDNVQTFPIYIRFEPTGDSSDWNLKNVYVTVNPGKNQIKYRLFPDNIVVNNFWLGEDSGKIVYIKA